MGRRDGEPLILTSGLWALAHDKGLLGSERKLASASGMTPKWWIELGEKLRSGEGLHPANAEVDAARVWACGGTVEHAPLAQARSLLREHRFSIMGSMLKSAWPKRPREALRAWTTVDNWARAPHELSATERRQLRAAWTARAFVLCYEQDAPIATVIMRSTTKGPAFLEAIGGEERAEQAYEMIHDERPDMASARGRMYAAEQALRGQIEDTERRAALWAMARSLEVLGMRQRAIRMYERIEGSETKGYAPSSTDEPKNGEARRRRLWLLWSNGVPEEMEEAISIGEEMIRDAAGTWRLHNVKRWTGGKAQYDIAKVRETRDAEHRAQAGGEVESIEQARVQLADAYLSCGLGDAALNVAWEKLSSPGMEGAMAKIGAQACVLLGKKPSQIAEQWHRALRNDPHNSEAMVGLASCEADEHRLQSAAQWAIRALWNDRRANKLTENESGTASEILLEAGRREASARADRTLLKRIGRTANTDVTVGISSRMLSRGNREWGVAIDRALDAIARGRAGGQTLCLLAGRGLREYADGCAENPARPAKAEKLQEAIRDMASRERRRTPPADNAMRDLAKWTLAVQSRIDMRVCARIPEPIAQAMRALALAKTIEAQKAHNERPLVGAAALKAAGLWEEWALYLPTSGHPHDERAVHEIERLRKTDPPRSERPGEWKEYHEMMRKGPVRAP